jgi:hypothetical protein
VIETPIGRGRAALARGAWEDPRDAFDAALREERSPEALDGPALVSRTADVGGAASETPIAERSLRPVLQSAISTPQ